MSAGLMTLHGTVAQGDKRGRDLGFATANINRRFPSLPYGVYASQTRLVGETKIWSSVSSYGVRPTFRGAEPRIETHILDFAADIYGCEIEVRLLAFVRPERRFASAAELVAAMQQDINQVRAMSFGG